MDYMRCASNSFRHDDRMEAARDYKKVSDLTHELNYARFESEHNEDKPLGEDYVRRFAELKSLEAETHIALEYSPTFDNGEVPSNKRRHSPTMHGLRRVYNRKQVAEWLDYINSFGQTTSLIARPDYVGERIELIYKRGYLVSAVAYGDGIYGEPILFNANEIVGVPHHLNEPIDISVRGVVTTSEYKLAETMLNTGEKLTAYQAVATGLRTINHDKVKQYGLSFVADGVGECPKEFIDKTQVNDYLYDIGFEVGELYNGLPEESFVDELITMMKRKYENDEADFVFEGVIFELGNLKLREQLEINPRYAPWSIAYEYTTDTAWTYLNDVTYGMDGNRIVFTGETDPFVNSNGANTSIKLGGFGNVEASDIMIGDAICLQDDKHYSADIVRRVHTPASREIELPTHCPICGTRLDSSDYIDLRCVNPECPTNAIAVLADFCDAWNIKNVSMNTICDLVDRLHIYTPAQLLSLRHDQLEDLGYSIAKCDLIIEQIRLTRAKSFVEVLLCLNIGISQRQAEGLEKEFVTLKNLYRQKPYVFKKMPRGKQAKVAWDYLHDEPLGQFLLDWII